MGGVGPIGVVVTTPVLDDHPGLQQGVEPPRVEQFITKPAVERLDESVLPLLTG